MAAWSMVTCSAAATARAVSASHAGRVSMGNLGLARPDRPGPGGLALVAHAMTSAPSWFWMSASAWSSGVGAAVISASASRVIWEAAKIFRT